MLLLTSTRGIWFLLISFRRIGKLGHAFINVLREELGTKLEVFRRLVISKNQVQVSNEFLSFKFDFLIEIDLGQQFKVSVEVYWHIDDCCFEKQLHHMVIRFEVSSTL